MLTNRIINTFPNVQVSGGKHEVWKNPTKISHRNVLTQVCCLVNKVIKVSGLDVIRILLYHSISPKPFLPAEECHGLMPLLVQRHRQVVVLRHQRSLQYCIYCFYPVSSFLLRISWELKWEEPSVSEVWDLNCLLPPDTPCLECGEWSRSPAL